MNNIDCSPAMIEIAKRAKENFVPLPWQESAVLTGVGFNATGEKCIEFVEYVDEHGVLQQSYHGDLAAYDNRVVNFTTDAPTETKP